jgi:dihydroorotase
MCVALGTLLCAYTAALQAAEFVAQAGPNVAATITPQHLMYNRNEVRACIECVQQLLI